LRRLKAVVFAQGGRDGGHRLPFIAIQPGQPLWPGRDYFVLSKGHAGPALYSTLVLRGYFPPRELKTLNQNGTHLPSHPDRIRTLGVDATTGSLGQGVSIAADMALSHKLSAFGFDV
jgi:transketolase